jgi:hypothetical protein
VEGAEWEDWVTWKLEVRRSPWRWGFEDVSVSASVVPPVGVNSTVMSNACGTKIAVVPHNAGGSELRRRR